MKVTMRRGPSQRANPRRGYHDYLCTIEIEPEGSPQEQVMETVEFFHRQVRDMHGGWMWCDPPSKQTTDDMDIVAQVWTFGYGYDSGD